MVSFERFAASTILLATYGYEVTPDNDPLVKLNEVVDRLLFHPGAPGTTAMDLFPLRKTLIYYMIL